MLIGVLMIEKVDLLSKYYGCGYYNTRLPRILLSGCLTNEPNLFTLRLFARSRVKLQIFHEIHGGPQQMSGGSFNLVPKNVPKVDSKYRKIGTKIPVPESIPILDELRKYEPVSMTGQPPIVWDRAEGVSVFDKWGNKWLDWSSGVLVTNAGHGRREIVEAICEQAQHGLLHNYCFPSEIRARLAKRLVELSPPEHEKAFILTTGSEATECALKLARTHGRSVGGDRKIGMISFSNAFHGRTLGAQQMGGSPALKEWIVNTDPSIVQVDFPDGFRCKETSFDHFLGQMEGQGVTPDGICGVITETFQGGGASFAPVEYMQSLRNWCNDNNIVLICDEIQAAFGRTGTHFFGYQHYGIVPDLITLGKGISSSMPISAVVGRKDLLDQYPPGSMTSTHTGNPLCCAAALTSIDLIETEHLVSNAGRVGEVLQTELQNIMHDYKDIVGACHGKGLVAGLQVVEAGTESPDSQLALDVVQGCIEKGLLFFAPVGFGGGTVKIAPPPGHYRGSCARGHWGAARVDCRSARQVIPMGVPIEGI